MNQRNNDFNSFVLGLIVGGILGTLYAPQKGEETRKVLKKLIEQWSEKGENLSEEVKEVFEEWKEKTEPAIEMVEEKITPITENIKERMIEKINPIEEVKEEEAPSVGEATTPPLTATESTSTTSLPELEPGKFYHPTQNNFQNRPKFFKGV